MADYKIITESTADLPDELVKSWRLRSFRWNSFSGTMYITITRTRMRCPARNFYGRLATGEMSKTNQVNTITFIEAFEPWLAQGMDVLLIGFSLRAFRHARAGIGSRSRARAKYPSAKLLQWIRSPPRWHRDCWSITRR